MIQIMILFNKYQAKKIIINKILIIIIIKVNKYRKKLKDQRKKKEIKIVTMIASIMYKNINNKNKIVKSKTLLR